MSKAGSVWRDAHCLWPIARLASTPWSRAKGLLGKSCLSEEEALWLRHCSAVHTWGMGFPIDLVWLDGDGRILALREGLRPWRWAWPHVAKARDTLELAAGGILQASLEPGQRLEWRFIPQQKETAMKESNAKSRVTSQKGAGAVEFLVAIPVLLGLILGTLQISLLYQARLQLEVAAQDAARAGALHGGDLEAIRAGLAEGLTPLYAHGQSLGDLVKARARAEAAARLADIKILSPTVEALHDHKEFGRLPLDDKTGQQSTPGGNWGWGIPESHLGYRKTNLGAESGLSVQDANLLKIKVTYHHPLIVAFVDHLFARFDSRNTGKGSVLDSSQGGQGALEQSKELQDRTLQTFPLNAEATYRMQTPFTHFAGLQTVSQLQAPQPGGKETYTPPSAGNGGGGEQGGLQPIDPQDPGIPPYGENLPPSLQFACD